MTQRQFGLICGWLPSACALTYGTAYALGGGYTLIAVGVSGLVLWATIEISNQI